jgi:hypothetical protein
MKKRRKFIVTIYDDSGSSVELTMQSRERPFSLMLGDFIASLYTNTDVQEISIRTEEVE